MGGLFQLFQGKGRGSQGTGPPPSFWPFIVSLRTVMSSVSVSFSMLMYYNECIMRFKLY